MNEAKFCCNCKTLMKYDNASQSLVYSVNADIKTWTCMECGHFMTIIEDQLDEEELEALKEGEEE
jgi:RNase P subunit RPR2